MKNREEIKEREQVYSNWKYFTSLRENKESRLISQFEGIDNEKFIKEVDRIIDDNGPQTMMPHYRFLFKDKEILHEIIRISYFYITEVYPQRSENLKNIFTCFVKFLGVDSLKTKSDKEINPDLLENLTNLD